VPFLEKLSGVVWHLGCVTKLALPAFGRPVRTAQIGKLGGDLPRNLFILKEDFCLLILAN